MPLISEVVETILAIQNDPLHEELVFIIPVSIEALTEASISRATLEDRVQAAIIAELNEALA